MWLLDFARELNNYRIAFSCGETFFFLFRFFNFKESQYPVDP